MTTEYLSLKKITALHGEEIQAAVDRVVRSGWYLQGEATQDFETRYAHYIGTRHCVTCGNGYDALWLMLRAYKELGRLRDGDEVIVAANTFIATILAISENGLKPRLVEPSADTLEIDDRLIEQALGKVSVFSDLNNLADISMDERYESICGITEEEALKYFEESIKALAGKYKMSYGETCTRLRKRYDGYHFMEHATGIYNPFSLLNTFSSGKFGSYWFETGTPSFLVRLLQRDHFYLPDLTRQEVSGEYLNSIDPLDESPLAIIYQSGYLTIKGYDETFKLYALGYPNEEVEEGFANYLLPYYTHVSKASGPMFIVNFVRDLECGKPEEFMKRMQVVFADTDYKIIGDAELYFQNAFYIVTKLLGFYTNVERTLSDGRIDMIAQTKDYVYIFEFKYDKSADAALRQIADKGYDRPFAADARKLYKIGVNFSRQHRCIDDWKVEEQ